MVRPLPDYAQPKTHVQPLAPPALTGSVVLDQQQQVSCDHTIG